METRSATGGPGGVILVLGGARSGKSGFALKRAEGLSGRRVFIATAGPSDEEMAERIRRHREARGPSWSTVEEPVKPGAALFAPGVKVAVVDCLTIWISNLMARGLGDDEVLEEAASFIESAARSGASVVAVSNEVGLSIVPENALARRFRDVAGLVNQRVAAAAREVWFVAAGIPLRIK